MKKRKIQPGEDYIHCKDCLKNYMPDYFTAMQNNLIGDLTVVECLGGSIREVDASVCECGSYRLEVKRK